MPNEEAERTLRPETVQEIYSLLKDVPEKQYEVASRSDAKIVSVFGASSVAIGLGGFSLNNQMQSVGTASAALFTLSLVVYVAVLYVSASHLWPKGLRVLEYADLWRRHWDQSPEDLRHAVIERLSEIVGNNERVLDEKAASLKHAVIGTGIQVILIVLALLSSTPLRCSQRFR